MYINRVLSSPPTTRRMLGWIVVGIMLAVWGGSFREWKGEDGPVKSLMAYSKYQRERHNVFNVSTISIDRMAVFSGAACVVSPTLEGAAKAMVAQLRNSVPEEVVREILEGAFVEDTSVRNSYQNSTLGLSDTGEGNAYLVYYDTEVSTRGYHSCVMVSGIRLVIAETVVGTIEEKTARIIGSTPCHCGMFTCERCPIVQEVITHRPVFHRATLTMDEAKALQQHLVQRATDAALALTGPGEEGKIKDGLQTAWDTLVAVSAADSIEK
jgi:hypothetical protein